MNTQNIITALAISLASYSIGCLRGEHSCDPAPNNDLIECIDIAKAWQDKYNALADTVIADQQRRIARYDSLKK